MPTYDYVCQACDHEFEEFQSITAKPLRNCPACKKPKLKRLIGTGAGIIFKGSGFYETDYRSNSYKQAAKAEKESSTSSSSSSESKGDSGSSSSTKADSAAASSSTTESKGSTASKPAKSAKPKKSE
jgi:putative FmdB family regulatory protein